jgi:DNA-directed RNA polymerase subunit alpha
MPGAAITSIKISDVYHEFSPIPKAKEDTTAFILHVKKIRLRSYLEDNAKLHLEIDREGEITAGDIQCPSGVEIVNPELHLLTIDEPDSGLIIDFTVGRGKGYSPAEERGKLPIGEIPIDAIYGPIRKVAYNVERTRVGQEANFDKLILDVWTDGTISPQEAFSEAGRILAEQFLIIAGFGEVLVEKISEAVIPPHIFEMPIEDLELSTRAFNCLKRAGIIKVGEILERLIKGDEEILVVRNFGKRSLDELKERLAAKGLMAFVDQGRAQAAAAKEAATVVKEESA